MTPPVPGAQRQGLTRLPLCVLLPLLLVLLAPPAQLVRGLAQSQEEQNPDINSFLSPEDSEGAPPRVSRICTCHGATSSCCC